VRELGHVPRDLYFFSQTNKSLSDFIDERVNQYGLEISKYYDAMKMKHNNSQSLVTQSIFRLFYYQNYNFDTTVQRIGDFIDLSICYRKGPTEFIPLSQATTRALLLLNIQINSFSLEANIKSQLSFPDKEGFECLIWSLLLRDAVTRKKLTFQPYHLNGKKAGMMELSFQQFANLEKDRKVPPTYLSQNILYRPWANFPRWDFVSPSCFFQVSVSTFDVHNSDRAKIDLSFGKSAKPDKYNPNISETLELITGSNDYTTKIDNDTLCVLKDEKVQNFNFIYITLDKPNHPQLFKKYSNLLVLSAKEVWGQGLL